MFDALRKWRDARSHLDSATKSYLESLAGLDSGLRASSGTINADALESIALEAQQDLSSLDNMCKNLTAGSVVLGRIRNRSVSLVPANNLPCEVLLKIFRLCAQKNLKFCHSPLFCSGQHYSACKLILLTHVCAGWRTILLATPSFWSHVDLEPLDTDNHTDATNYIQLCLDRAQRRPLCFDLDFLSFTGNTGVSELSMVTFLQPHTANLQSIYLRDWEQITDVTGFFSLWFGNPQVESVQNLVIWRQVDETTVESFICDPSASEHGDALLLPIRVLRLNGIALEWKSLAYQNLVHLHIGGLPISSPPAVDEILDILASCPELHTLQFIGMWVRESRRPHLQPVILNQLRILDLYGSHSGADWLLPFLVIPQTNVLSFRLDVGTYATPAIQEFLDRTNVTRLFISMNGLDYGIEGYLAHAQNVTTLIIGRFSDGNALMEAMADSARSLYPKLQTLYLYSGSLSETSLPRAVKALPSLKKIRTTSCFLRSSYSPPIRRIKSSIPDTLHNIGAEFMTVEYSWYDIMN